MTSLLNLDRGGFADGFNRRPQSVSHALAGHRLLTVGALAALADDLPADFVERNRGDLPLIEPGGSERGGVAAPGSSVLALPNNHSWMVLWNVEQVPEYRRLLDDCLDEVAPVLPPQEGRMSRREAFVFLSSAGAQTPAHFDPEHNLLLQVQGRKEVSVGRYVDPGHEAAELTRYYGGGHRNMVALPALDTAFLMGPGDGLYVPMLRPHWVRNHDAVSISLSITFRTTLSERAELVHMLNARLCRLGLRPHPPGCLPRIDRLKEGAVRGWARLHRRPANAGHLATEKTR